MKSADEHGVPVKAKIALVDSASLTVVWMNGSAARDLTGPGDDLPPGVPIDSALPMTGAVGVPEALRKVAASGTTEHLRTELVSTAKGSMVIATSIYRLPDGMLLVVTENAWQPKGGSGRGSR